MADNRSATLLPGRVDWIAVGAFLVLMLLGWLNIYAAVYDESHPMIFDLARKYGMQALWIGVSLALAVVILVADERFYHVWAYPLYCLFLLVLVAVLFVGKEVNGARSWIVLGPVSLQPAEFMKFATALAVARYMSTYHFSIHTFKDLFRVGLILGLPVAVILLQNDTGSALVYGSFLLMLYREGLNGWIYVILAMVIGLFVGSFLLNPPALLAALVLVCTLGEGVMHGRWRDKIGYLAAVALGTLVIYFGLRLCGAGITLYLSLLAATVISLAGVAVYAYREKLRRVYLWVVLFFGSLLFTQMVDLVFGKLQLHQQKRILDLLGLESDLKGWGYNVNQSKIAIGSGGWFGKGFLHGTQTRYNFVPEQSTDFIFCTVGEEWGFVGSAAVLALFCVLILRLVKMGERQQEAFGRIYCYSVAGVFLFHVLVNVGMTVGVMPVIGIPLPLFSYGGSSLLAFTALFFVAVKLDAGKRAAANGSIVLH